MDQKDLEEKVNDIHRAVDDIRRVVVGNVEYKQKGLIERVQDLEQHQQALTDQKEAETKRLIKWVGSSAAGGSLIGFGLSKAGLGKAFAVFLKAFGL